jgi:hypothetical protein
MHYIGAIIEHSTFHIEMEKARTSGSPVREMPIANPAHLADLLQAMDCVKGQLEAIFPEVSSITESRVERCG